MRYDYVPESHAAHEAYDPFAVTRTPFPEPAVSSRDGVTAYTAPGPVTVLAALAKQHGWQVITQYATGYMPHGTTGKPGHELRESIAVRFGGHPDTERQAYAVYAHPIRSKQWQWQHVMIWGPDLPPFAGCGLAELKTFLALPQLSTGSLLEWVRHLRNDAKEVELLQKRRDAFRKQVRAEVNTFPADWAGTSWPGQLCGALVQAWNVFQRADGLYTSEELSKIIASSKSTDREGRR